MATADYPVPLYSTAIHNDVRVPLQRVKALYRISDRLMQAEDEAEAFLLGARSLVEQGGYKACWITTIDYETSLLHGKAVAGQSISPELAACALPLDQFPVTTDIIANGELRVISDSAAQAEAEGWSELARKIGMPAFVCLPFGVGSEVSGLLLVALDQNTPIDETIVLLTLCTHLLTTTLMRLQAIAERTRQLAALQRALQDQERLLETVREMSTPAIPVYDGILALPLVGNIDSTRAGQIMEAVLEGVAREHASVVIVDVTGVPIIDTGVANHLVQVTQAAQLLGAKALLVGIKPEVAQTLVQLGVDLRSIVTRSDLQAGMAFAFEQLGLRIIRTRG